MALFRVNNTCISDFYLKIPHNCCKVTQEWKGIKEKKNYKKVIEAFLKVWAEPAKKYFLRMYI